MNRLSVHGLASAIASAIKVNVKDTASSNNAPAVPLVTPIDPMRAALLAGQFRAEANAWRPPVGHWARHARPPQACTPSSLTAQGVQGRPDLRVSRDQHRLYVVHDNPGATASLRRLHAKPKGKAARRQEKRERRLARETQAVAR